MNKSAIKNIFVPILVVFTIIVVFAYLFSLKKQVSVLDAQREALMQALGKEKELSQELSEENSVLKDNLRAYKNKITKLLAENAVSQKSLEELKSKFSLLEAENKTVREENEGFKSRVECKTGIKGALGELRRQTIKVCREIRQKVDENKLMEGNRGYVIKDGKATLPAKVKIEVVPAPAQ